MRKFNLTYKIIHTVMKLCFSAVFLQLLYISFILTEYAADAVTASSYLQPRSSIPEMLEIAALSAVITVCGGYLMERTLLEAVAKR